MKYRILIAAAALLCFLTACGEREPQPEPAETGNSLLLVESRQEEEDTTAAETQAAALPEAPETASPTQAPTVTAPTETAPAPSAETEGPQAPVITKEPTGESVLEGEEAWFIAHADHADSVSWQFLEDDLPQSREHVASVFPDLKVENPDSDTLILKNVPWGMSGWAVQAVFQNGSGSTASAPAVITVTEQVPIQAGELPAAYLPVIENCRFIQYFNFHSDSQDQLTQRDPYNLYDGMDLIEGNLGYCLLDLDSNGTPELILGSTAANAFGDRGGDIIFAMFTLRDGSPVKILQSRSRNRHYLSRDNRIYYEGVSSASTGIFTILRLEGSELIPCRDLWTEVVDGQARAFYSATGSKDPASVQRLDDPQLYKIQAEMIASRQPLPPLNDII